jgi:hypothetical protein
MLLPPALCLAGFRSSWVTGGTISAVLLSGGMVLARNSHRAKETELTSGRVVVLGQIKRLLRSTED